MTAERELPSGFTYKELPEIRAKIPLPNGWFSKEAKTHPQIFSYYLSREPITGPGTLIINNKAVVPEDISGFYQTGLTLYAHSQADKLFGRPPSQVAKKFITVQNMIPEGSLVLERDENFVVYRRRLYTLGGLILGRRMPPTKFYLEATANDRTGALYTMIFETPQEKWEENQEIAKVMIENRIFAQDF